MSAPEIPIPPAVAPAGPPPRQAWTIIGLVLIIALGIGLRLKTYLDFQGLHHDDALLSSNIIRHDELRLLKPLDHWQAAPVGHLLVEKEVVRALGTGERALRLPVQVASILALLACAGLFRRIMPPVGQLLALALIATSPQILHFSGTVKQYSGDILFAAVLLLAGLHALVTREGTGRFAWLGAAGLVAVGFSQPSVFMLGGIGLTLILGAILDRRYRDALTWIAVASAWLAAFATLYLLIYKAYAADSVLTDFWKDGFAPFPPRSPEQVKWYADNFFGVFASTLGAKFTGLAGVLFLAGCAHLARQHRGRELSMLVSPLLLTLAASALHKYPFGDRLLLFASPMLAGLMGAGLASLVEVPNRSGRAFITLALATILLQPAYMSFKTLKGGPFVDHDIKPALAYLSDHYREGDEIYLDDNATALTDYYRDIINFKDTKRLPFIHGKYVITGRPVDQELAAYAKDLEQIRGKKRIWIILAMNYDKLEPMVTTILDPLGERIDAFHGKGSVALLYDLSRGAAPAEAPRPAP